MGYYTISYIIIGDSGVGKTALLNRFGNKSFLHDYNSTIGVDYKSHRMMLDEFDVKMMIWDTAGQEHFRSISQSYYRNIAGALIVYDVENPGSLYHVERWLKDLRNVSPNAKVVIVGNKAESDDRLVTYAEGKSISVNKNCQFIEVSAKSGTGIENMFNMCTREILQNIKPPLHNDSPLLCDGIKYIDTIDIVPSTELQIDGSEYYYQHTPSKDEKKNLYTPCCNIC